MLGTLAREYRLAEDALSGLWEYEIVVSKKHEKTPDRYSALVKKTLPGVKVKNASLR